MRRMHPRGGFCALALTLLLLGCETAERDPEAAPAPADLRDLQERVVINPGAPVPTLQVINPYEGNREAIDEGGRLYGWFNCSGCHSPGGGGAIGPPLMDGEWIYGGDPGSIYESIVEGRPNGMPTWGGKIPEEQVWKLVAYIRSMGAPAAPARKMMPIGNDPDLDDVVRRRQ
jgi:cytochrome c oxidase cbb3-type subunit 3